MRRAALAGITGPIGFLLLAFALAALRPDIIVTQGWKSWPSSMSLGGPPGIPQIANFIALGLCYIAFSLGALKPALAHPLAWVGFLVIAAGEGLLAFPTDAPEVGPTWHGSLHLAGVIVVTIATVVAATGVTLAVHGRRGWRLWSYVAPIPLVASAIGLVGGFDHGWAKVVFVVGTTLPVAVVGALLRREASAARSEG